MSEPLNGVIEQSKHSTVEYLGRMSGASEPTLRAIEPPVKNVIVCDCKHVLIFFSDVCWHLLPRDILYSERIFFGFAD